MLSFLKNLWGSRFPGFAPEPTLWSPVSQGCTQAQMEEPTFAYWCGQFGETPRLHRKQWEYCYILQALSVSEMLEPGKRGLGFGVGKEPLPAVFASRGVSVLATDLEPEQAHGQGWVATEQYAASKIALNDRNICPPEKFEQQVGSRFMDMNAIDPSLTETFDFVWSSCAFEHLGSIHQGLEFVIRSAACLKPGGVAVHTTEFNCYSNSGTVDMDSTVLFRKKDFLWLADRLKAKGYEMEFNFNLGQQPMDLHVDVPPYKDDKHLKLQIQEWTVTSFGLIIRKT